jgi:glycosyltransferase 2 family protein
MAPSACSAMVERSIGRTSTKKGIAARWSRWIFAVLLVGAVVAAALHFGDLKRFAALLTKARPAWLAAALALQAATYLFLSAQWWLALRDGGSPLPFRKLIPLTITKLFADQVIPTAGVSGNVLLIDRLCAKGVPRKNSVAATILAIIAYYVSYAVTTVVTVILLWITGKLTLLLFGLAALLLAVAAGIPACVLWLSDKSSRSLPRWLRDRSSVRELMDLVGEAPRGLVRDPKLIAQLALLNLGVFMADAATLAACLLAVGERAHMAAAFVAFSMASIVVTLGPVPLGLGSFEATSTGMLRLLGVSFEAAVAATLLYRGFALWLPLALGLVLTRREFKRG